MLPNWRLADDPKREKPIHHRRPKSSKGILLALIAAAATLLLVSSRPNQQQVNTQSTKKNNLPQDNTPVCIPDDDYDDAQQNQPETYLVYAPQFGLSNQFVALRTAIMWALMLNRTLVLPHILGHEDATTRVPFESLFEITSATHANKLLPLRFITMEQFLALGLNPPHLIALNCKIVMAKATDAYFTELGLDWIGYPGHVGGRLPPRNIVMPSFQRSSIQQMFATSACRKQRVLAFRSLYAAIETKTPMDYPAPGRSWLNQVAMPTFLKPERKVRLLIETIVQGVVGKSSGLGTNNDPRQSADILQSPFICIHVRRGDFVRDCPRYMAESQSRDGRRWTKSHAKKGWSCLQTEEELKLNVQSLHSSLPLFIASEVASIAQQPPFLDLNASSLSKFNGLIGKSLPFPPALIGAVLDQLVCSHAQYLLVNGWSTFSQLVMGHIGLRYPRRIGWAQDLTPRDQNLVGVVVRRLLRSDCFEPGVECTI